MVLATLWTRIAFVSLFGVLLIPIALSSMRGLSHTLTCSEQVESPFQVFLEPGSPPVMTGAATLTPDGGGGLCGGLLVSVEVVALDDGRVRVTVPITNTTDADWFGTVQFEVAGTRIPLDLGKVRAGETRQAGFALNLPAGVTEFDGRLLVGP